MARFSPVQTRSLSHVVPRPARVNAHGVEAVWVHRATPLQALPGTHRANGRKIRSTETFTTKADAGAWLANIESEVHRGTWIDPLLGQENFADYATRWLDARTLLRKSTRGKYGRHLRLHILPVLGKKELSSITATDVRHWYYALAKKHKVTADDCYRTLRVIMNTALADGRIAKSPMTVKGAGTVATGERPTGSVAEIQAAVDAIPERYRVVLLLGAWCQARISEILALQRCHIDLEARTVRIEQTWIRPETGPAEIGPPKTEAGKRTIGMPNNVVPVLAEHLENFVGPKATDWLIGTKNGTAVSYHNFSREWTKARKVAGRPDLHFHDLRHTGLTWSASTGASLAELMHRGGHANPRAAIRYQHATKDQDKALTAALSKLASL